MDLANSDVQERIAELNILKKYLPGFQVAARKEHILHRMQKLIPGNSEGAVNGILDPSNGATLTDTQPMADALTKHWGDVFSKKTIDEAQLDAWLSELRDKLPFSGDPEEFVPSASHIEEAIDLANE